MKTIKLNSLPLYRNLKAGSLLELEGQSRPVTLEINPTQPTVFSYYLKISNGGFDEKNPQTLAYITEPTKLKFYKSDDMHIFADQDCLIYTNENKVNSVIGSDENFTRPFTRSPNKMSVAEQMRQLSMINQTLRLQNEQKKLEAKHEELQALQKASNPKTAQKATKQEGDERAPQGSQKIEITDEVKAAVLKEQEEQEKQKQLNKDE